MLIVSAILTGILTALVIRFTTDPAALRETRNRMHAHLLEFRLFFDEPGLIWRAQVALLRDNLRLFRLLLLPALILVPAMTWLVMQLDALYGYRLLRSGEAAVVTAQLQRPIASSDTFQLSAARGFAVETPAVRAFQDHQISWRIRSIDGAPGELDITLNGRAARLPRLPEGGLAWVKIDYPKAASGVPWEAWFFTISTAAALLTSRGRSFILSRSAQTLS
jgi:hypothetical protein